MSNTLGLTPERLPPTSETAEAIAFVLECIAEGLRRKPSPDWHEALKYTRECEATLTDVAAQLDETGGAP